MVQLSSKMENWVVPFRVQLHEDTVGLWELREGLPGRGHLCRDLEVLGEVPVKGGAGLRAEGPACAKVWER